MSAPQGDWWGGCNVPKRVSIELHGSTHVNPIPAASMIGPFLASGAITGREPDSGDMPTDLGRQCANVFHQVRALLEVVGGTTDDILKMTFHLAAFRDRDALNHEWLAMFPDSTNRPARQVIAAQLDGGALIHCDLLAVVHAPSTGSAGPDSAPAPAVPDSSTTQ